MKRTLFFLLVVIFALNATATDLVVNSSRSYPLAQVQSLEFEYNNETASTYGIFTFSDGSTERVADLQTIAFSFKTALDNTQGNNALLIYPNPTQDYIQIENARAGDMLVYTFRFSNDAYIYCRREQ